MQMYCRETDYSWNCLQIPNIDLLNLGGVRAPKAAATSGVDLLNLSAPSKSGDELLQDLFNMPPPNGSLLTKTSGPPKPAAASPFFTLDPFDPFTGNSAAPTNISSSASFGNFATIIPTKADGDTLMGNWDSIMNQKLPSSVPTPPTIPRNSSTPNLEAKMKDPLADLGNLTGLTNNSSWGPAKTNTPMNAGNFHLSLLTFFFTIFKKKWINPESNTIILSIGVCQCFRFDSAGRFPRFPYSRWINAD